MDLLDCYPSSNSSLFSLTNPNKLTTWFYVWVASLVGTQSVQSFLDGHCPLTVLEGFLRHTDDKITFIDRIIGTQIPQSVTIGLLSVCLVLGFYVIFKFKINGKEKNFQEKRNKKDTRDG